MRDAFRARFSRLVCCLGLEGWNPRTSGKDGAPLQYLRLVENRLRPKKPSPSLLVDTIWNFAFESSLGIEVRRQISRVHQILPSRLPGKGLCASSARARLGAAYMRLFAVTCKKKFRERDPWRNNSEKRFILPAKL